MTPTGLRGNVDSRFGTRGLHVFCGATLLGTFLGCASGQPATSTSVSPGARFPAMPAATGPVAIRVVYPPRNVTISVSGDSTFIFGSVGHGGATLTINGHAVPVFANGSFLAYLPVPRETQGYSVEATVGSARERLEHSVRITPRAPILANDAALSADPQSVRPAAVGRWTQGERVLVSVRANADASVMLELADARRIPLTAARATVRDSTLWQREVTVEDLAAPARLVIARGGDTVTRLLPIQQLIDSLGERRIARLVSTTAVPDTDQVVVARPVPNGTYKWLLLPGTLVEVTGRVGGQARIRLDAQLQAWTDSAAVDELAQGAVMPRRVVGNPRVVAPSDSAWADVILPMVAPAPYLIDELDGALAITLYGTTLDIDIAVLRSDTSVVRNITWSQIASDRGQVVIHLTNEPFGYHVRWQPGALVVRVRRPPTVAAGRPLAGLTIAVDPGHPPVGATGPTGLYEGDAVLPIAERLRSELERRGARVVLTRTTRDPVALADRPVIARRADAHAFVSIHLNALPDGVNPFTSHGTGTYFFHAQSAQLARDVQAGMVREMGLRDLGIFYDNLAVVRQTWMPSILCEGAFLMIPEQEALIRTAEFQQAYATGVADGLERFFGRMARR